MSPIVRDLSNIAGASLLKAHAQETASTTGSSVAFAVNALYQGVMFVANISANGTASGSNTLQLLIEGSNDNSTWETVSTFTAWDVGTAAGLIIGDFDSGAGMMPYYRYRSVETGTADVTYSVLVFGVNPSQANVTQV